MLPVHRNGDAFILAFFQAEGCFEVQLVVQPVLLDHLLESLHDVVAAAQVTGGADANVDFNHLFFLPRVIVDMQQFVHAALEDAAVQRQHERVFFRTLDAAQLVGCVQPAAALGFFFPMGKGLAAAVDAAARAGHHFDKIEVFSRS